VAGCLFFFVLFLWASKAKGQKDEAYFSGCGDCVVIRKVNPPLFFYAIKLIILSSDQWINTFEPQM
jgi:hypothetical protein